MNLFTRPANKLCLQYERETYKLHTVCERQESLEAATSTSRVAQVAYVRAN